MCSVFAAGEGKDAVADEWGTAAEEQKAHKAQQARKAELVMEETDPAIQTRAALVFDLFCTAVGPPRAPISTLRANSQAMSRYFISIRPRSR